ncbi:hypothetical protein GCM10007094_23860 [Pseudovibrio japonicus]|uniref:Uncharacterized protein n=1 Tax=Pseudovibrio japonicus TaxID=366534 RepID=A0ABQ3EET0_9HYPH|nr:hypothetical protein [Pseudovibrio japonicus]GHB34056.1 hypothetical protein GCM10007094_23860 [Pseudovibrio japonicus]
MFEDLVQMASDTIDDIMSDGAFMIYPRSKANVNAQLRADQSRQEHRGEQCILCFQSQEFGIELGVRKTYRESNDFRTVSVGRELYLSVDATHLPDYEVKQGDLVELLDKPGLGRMEILDQQPDGKSRTLFRLSKK